MKRITSFLLIVLWLAAGQPASAQNAIEDARTAIGAGELARAISLLTGEISRQPSAEAYLYLGIAYAHSREWIKAEESLKQGSEKFPTDPRFHNELAGVYLANNDLDRAKDSLQKALSIDPDNKYAADLLATVDMSMGRVRAALDRWNRDDQPVVGDVLHNSHLTSESWIVDKASEFKSGNKLTWANWRTTEARLWESRIFSNVGIEIEPTSIRDRYTAIIRTTEKTNGRNDFFSNGVLAGIFFYNPELNFWNAGNSGLSFFSSYRYAAQRRLGEAGTRGSIPLPGLLFFDARGIWRYEHWNISDVSTVTGPSNQFVFKSTGFLAQFKYIPDYRVEIAGGYEYRNRAASGTLPGLELNDLNSGKLLLRATILPFEGNRYENRLQIESFIARKAFFSDLVYTGGTVEFNNRYSLKTERPTTIHWSLKGGTARGSVPIDEYFMLGVQQYPSNPLRGHGLYQDGKYSDGPMGTDFFLFNSTLVRRIVRLPLLGNFNLPYVDLNWQVFGDAAKTFDRARVFQQGKLLVDVGGGFKIDMPRTSLNLTYGRSLRDGQAVWSAYLEKRW